MNDHDESAKADNESAFQEALFAYVESGDQAAFEEAPIYGGRYSMVDVRRAEETVRQAGVVRGRYFGEWYEMILQLKRDARYDEALELLLEIIDATERAQAQERANVPIAAAQQCIPECEVDIREPPSAWTEHAAVIYRKQGRLDDEIAIIDRWLAHADSPTQRARRSHAEFVARKKKAEVLRAKRR